MIIMTDTSDLEAAILAAIEGTDDCVLLMNSSHCTLQWERTYPIEGSTPNIVLCIRYGCERYVHIWAYRVDYPNLEIRIRVAVRQALVTIDGIEEEFSLRPTREDERNRRIERIKRG